MQAGGSALLRVLAALIGTLVAAGLTVLAALLLLLAIAIRLRFLFILLVGVVSHFPSPCAAKTYRCGVRETLETATMFRPGASFRRAVAVPR
jgi:hypothetical protein